MIVTVSARISIDAPNDLRIPRRFGTDHLDSFVALSILAGITKFAQVGRPCVQTNCICSLRSQSNNGKLMLYKRHRLRLKAGMPSLLSGKPIDSENAQLPRLSLAVGVCWPSRSVPSEGFGSWRRNEIRLKPSWMARKTRSHQPFCSILRPPKFRSNPVVCENAMKKFDRSQFNLPTDIQGENIVAR